MNIQVAPIGIASLFLTSILAAGCGTVSKNTDTDSSMTTGDVTETTEDMEETTTEGRDCEYDTEADPSAGNPEFPNCPSGQPLICEGENIMGDYGRPCVEDNECEFLGEGFKCVHTILEVAHPPGGYCSRDCELPDGNTKYVKDHVMCGPGVTCLGVRDFFEACAIECTSDDQCQREGYECRLLPVVGGEGEPKFCLMVDDCVASDAPPP